MHTDMQTVRPEIHERYYKVFTYQPVDRVTDMEFGFWPQTIRRWLGEGLPLELTPEQTNQMFNSHLNRFFGSDEWGHGFSAIRQMIPPFEEEVLERKAESVIKRGADGIVAEWFPPESPNASIPNYIEFPVKTPGDWKQLKRRYRLDDPARHVNAKTIQALREARDAGTCIGFSHTGFYGQLRHWLGTENLSYAFYDYPAMIHEMVDLWSELAFVQLRELPDDIVIDSVNWWEDLAGRQGPLVSPKHFHEFMLPGYRKVMDEARRRGCAFATVDSDGNPHDLIHLWLEVGVNVMHPMEVAAGVDPFAWRREFGRELRLRGGIDKREIAKGVNAIDAELERIAPLIDGGGYIPHLDHLVPPDISYDHYCCYRERKRALIGKT